MRRFRGFVLLACCAGTPALADPASSCTNGAPIALSRPSCGPVAAPTLSCALPDEIEGALAQPDLNTVQRANTVFSWQQFIALNWPAAAPGRGEPATERTIAAPGPRVWETWKETYEVFLPEGAAPPGWNEPQAVPGACAGAHKILTRRAKVSDVLDESLQALGTDATLAPILKDQQGRALRYEIRLNRTAFDYLVANRLYDGRTQARLGQIAFPVGSRLLKAAWREIDADADDHFLATDACVCDSDAKGSLRDCAVKRMGLAGWHLTTRTASAPQWIWSTFEHVDNVRSTHADVAPLNNPDCDAAQCPPNRQTPKGVPTQLTRVVPIAARDPDCSQPTASVDNVAAVNADVQQALAAAGSVVANYQLIDTQWPLLQAQTGNRNEFVALPPILGNTTMESFAQDSSSCMGCHAMARSLNPQRFVGADFSFSLNNARPMPRDADCENVEGSESCAERRLAAPTLRASPAVRHGFALARETYELAARRPGPPVVGNQLHCQSCHLHAGRDPDAAWWVGSEQRMKSLEGLQARINQCFAHSMNGRALCTPGQDCDDDRDMRGLVSYIRWLTRQYQREHPGRPPAKGFPALADAPTPPDAERGAAVYVQKCSACHARDGAGRYAGGYFRPALWGPHSYNAQAGMAQTPMLAAFLAANMPFTSGGLLSVQEAWDLATYINAQPRPAAPTPPASP